MYTVKFPVGVQIQLPDLDLAKFLLMNLVDFEYNNFVIYDVYNNVVDCVKVLNDYFDLLDLTEQRHIDYKNRVLSVYGGK